MSQAHEEGIFGKIRAVLFFVLFLTGLLTSQRSVLREVDFKA